MQQDRDPASPGYGPPPGGFGSPTGGFGPPDALDPRLDFRAVVSLIFGILAIPGCCSWFSGLPLAGVGVAMGILALRNVQANPQMWKGRELAVAGIVCSAVAILLGAAVLLVPWGSPMMSVSGRALPA